MTDIWNFLHTETPIANAVGSFIGTFAAIGMYYLVKYMSLKIKEWQDANRTD